MFRLILFISLFPIAIALVARWWFGMRVIAAEGGRACRCDLGRWLPTPCDEAVIHRAEESAAEFGKQLRSKALAEWKEQDVKAERSRANSLRFGMAVPPLSGIVAVMAVLVGKVPVTGAIAILLGATALSAAFGLLTLPPELAAIARAARKVRAEKQFPNSEDEDAVIRCAVAHAWDHALPPILRWFHR